MFSDFVIAYLFLGGTGGGALVVLSLLECANACRRFALPRVSSGIFSDSRLQVPDPRSFRARFALPDEVLKCGWVICAVTLALGIIFLFMDLGRPERVFALLTHPNLSAITVGSYALILALLLSVGFCLAGLMDSRFLKARGIIIAGVCGVLVGLVVMAYTGFLLTQATAALIWMTPLVPVLFVLSSLSGGIAVVMLGAAFANTRQIYDRVLIRLGNIDTALIVLEVVSLAVWLMWGCFTAGPDLSAKALVSGELAAPFWLGLVDVGLVLPLFLEQYLNYSNHKTQTLMVAALVLFGAAMLRWCLVAAGGFDVTQTGEFISLQVDMMAEAPLVGLR